MKRISNILRSILPLAVLVIGGVLIAHIVFAAPSIEFPTSFADFSSQDLKVTIANIVRIVVGFIGIIFLVLVLYGGFVWMTSQGEPDKINRAKKIIFSATIGLLITLSAYSIAGFIVKSLQQATGGGPGGPGPGPGPGAIVCPYPGPGIVKICSVAGGSTPSGVLIIRGWNFEAYNAGTSHVWIVNGAARIEAVPIMCGALPQWISTSPFAQDSIRAIIPAEANFGAIGGLPGNYEVKVETQLGTTCVAPNCANKFFNAGVQPSIYCIDPASAVTDNNPATPPPGGTRTIAGTIALEGINFGAAAGQVEMEGNAGRFQIPADAGAIVSWTDTHIEASWPDDPTATPVAITGEVTMETSVPVPSANGVPFTVTCVNNAQCGSNCCSGNQCVAAAGVCSAGGPGGPGTPVISSISPTQGEEGTYVTITGSGFGTRPPNELHLLFTPTGDDYIYVPPAACGAIWSDTQIVMQVPDILPPGDPTNILSNGPAEIWVERAGVPPVQSNHVPFTVNDDPIPPGLCSVNPTSGPFTFPFTLRGDYFDPVLANNTVFFGTPGINEIAAGNPRNLITMGTPDMIDADIPNLQVGATTVAIRTGGPGGLNSNPLAFAATPSGPGQPIIFSVTPDDGPGGAYVTVNGSGFGSSGDLWFSDNPVQWNIPAPGTAPGDFNFPAQCSNFYWADDHIVVKAPLPLADGPYFIVVVNSDTNLHSQIGFVPNANEFTKDSLLAVPPGLCRVDPVGAPADFTPVNYFGDNFGAVKGDIWFDVNASVVMGPVVWNPSGQQALNARVPLSAVTGKTTVQLPAGGLMSNPLPFFVGACTQNAQCGLGNNCCSDGTCRTDPDGAGPLDGCDGTFVPEENNWQFITQNEPFGIVNTAVCTNSIIQSPTPYPFYTVYLHDGNPATNHDPAKAVQNAPLNAAIVITFNQALKQDIIPANEPGTVWNLLLQECGAAPGPGICAPFGDAATWKFSGSRGLKYDPFQAPLPWPTQWAPETWYRVNLNDPGAGPMVSKIRAADNSLFEGSDWLGTFFGWQDPDDFYYYFRTRAAGAPLCEVNDVVLTPGAVTAPVGGTSPAVSASPQSTQCFICGGAFIYNWECVPNPLPLGNEYARFAAGSLPGGDGLYCTPDDTLSPHGDSASFYGVNLSPDRQMPPVGPPLDITATIMNAPGAPPGGIPSSVASLLSVADFPPRVIGATPNESCMNVCPGAQPYVDFDQSVNIGANDMVIYQCDSKTLCTAVFSNQSQAVPLPSPQATMTWAGAVPPLVPGKWYLATVKDTITNAQGLPLTGLNYDSSQWNSGNALAGFNCAATNTCDSYAWWFKVTNTQCVMDGIEVRPLSATINAIGGTTNFAGLVYAEDAVCGRVYYDGSGYDWTWNVDPMYATMSVPSSGVGVTSLQTTAVLQTLAAGTLVTATAPVLPGPANATDDSTLYINDLRDPLYLIGHRPDDAPVSPPEQMTGGCNLGGNANQCLLNCTNVLTSAIFSTSIDADSLIDQTALTPLALYQFDNGTTDEASAAALSGTLRNNAFVNTSPSAALSGGNVELDSWGTCVNDPTASCKSNAGPSPFPHCGAVAGRCNAQPAIPCFDNVICNASLPGDTCKLTTCNPVSRMDIPNPLAGKESGTISFWINPFNTQPWFSYLAGMSAGQNFWMFNPNIWPAKPSIYAALYNEGASCNHFNGTPNILNLNQWNHVVMTYEYVSGDTTVKWYVNGQNILTEPNIFSAAACGVSHKLQMLPGDMIFGDAPNGWWDAYGFDGAIDEISFFEGALTASEVVQLYIQSQTAITTSKFYVEDLNRGTAIPGTISVHNYTANTGVCKANPIVFCDASTPCPAPDVCMLQRGQIDFTPTLGGQQGTPGSLTARYSFDTGFANDVTGNGNDGTLTGGVAATGGNTTIPSLGPGMSFDGSSGYIEVPTSASIDGNQGQITAAAWVYPTKDFAAEPWQRVITKSFWTAGAWPDASLSYHSQINNNGTFYAALNVNGLTCQYTTPITRTIPINTWSHVAYSYDGSRLRVFIDGSQIGSTACAGAIRANALPVGIGAGHDPATNLTQNYFWGEMDDVRIYDRGLTPTEIAAVRREGLGITTASLPGLFDPNVPYKVHLCDNASCAVNPITSTQGYVYDQTQTWAFTSGANVCSISFVDIAPNPAKFVDRQIECTPATQSCLPGPLPKTIHAQARDATGLDLAGITYAWRETDDVVANGYPTTFYKLDQTVPQDSDVLHKGVIGIDYNEVTADGTAIGVNTMTEQGRMDFLFCETPWIGQATGEAFYLDPNFDFRLSYCRDQQGNTMLPDLPTPHIQRAPLTPPFQFGGDLLKEHVFIVEGGPGVPSVLTSGSPSYTTDPATLPTATQTYRLNDVVAFKVDAVDPDGDRFLYVLENEAGDPLPPSVSFNERTGNFLWVVDQLPATGGKYDLTFKLNPVGGGMRPQISVSITIDMASLTPSAIVKPTLSFNNPPAGSHLSFDYGARIPFEAQVIGLGSKDGVAAASIRSFIWDFQDSGSTTYGGAHPIYQAEHVFLQAGLHQVSFRVQNNFGTWSDPVIVNIIIRPKGGAAGGCLGGYTWSSFFHPLDGRTHWYTPVISGAGGISWVGANNAAAALGPNTHLATITHDNENTFIYNLISDTMYWVDMGWVAGPFIGATDQAVEGTWAWVTGEPWAYTSWGPGEPNNVGGVPGEDYALYWGYAKRWNDGAGTVLPNISYIIETETNPCVNL